MVLRVRHISCNVLNGTVSAKGCGFGLYDDANGVKSLFTVLFCYGPLSTLKKLEL